MSSDQILGRSEEIEILEKLLKSDRAEFLAIYGRRRVGKTFLIDRYFRDKGLYFHFTGMKGASLQEHLKVFRSTYKRRLSEEVCPPIKGWIDAFELLMEKIDQMDKTQKMILFFDELPWIATRKSGFLKALEHFWNDYFSRLPNAVLIVCGSAASWMIEKIVQNKGGLHNRLTAKIRLEPFTLRQTKEFLEGNGIQLSHKQIIDIYLAIGGVAKYLTYIERGDSSSRIIQKLCFQKNSPLIDEYNQLYSSLFKNYQVHMGVVEALAKRRSGLTHTQLLKGVERSSGGAFSSILEELRQAGFIQFIPALNKKKKEGKFYLADEYSFFYLTWMKDQVSLKHGTLSPDYWLSMQGSAKLAEWSGFAFETLCWKHVSAILRGLGIQIVAEQAVCWTFPKMENQRSCQIDLIIDRRDQSMNLCEIKYYNSEVNFAPSDAEQINYRREHFRVVTKTRKTLFNTLISTYGSKENASFHEAFQNQLTMETFFN